MPQSDRESGASQGRIYTAERIITMEGDAPEGVAGIRTLGERITGYLTREAMASADAAGERITDYGARTLLPGFIDVHAHGEVAVRAAFGTVDCRVPKCRSIDDVLGALSAGLADRRGEWLVGQGNLFFDRKLSDGRLPTREELDRVSRNVPIALRAGGHITALNSAALEALGIDRDYREPEHSLSGKPVVIRDADGNPTGVVKEMDNLLPSTGPDDSELEAALAEGYRELFTRYGVTTVGEISETPAGLRAMNALAGRGELPVNIRAYLWVPGTMPLEDALNWRETLGLDHRADRFGVRGLKLFSDGGYSAKNAAVDDHYVGEPHNCGHIALGQEYLEEVLGRAAAVHLQVAIHANGPRAQRWVSQVIESLSLPAGAPRPRIEHAGNYMPDDDLPDAWRQADVLPVPQPVFLYTFGDFFPDYLGEVGRRGRFPLRSLFEQQWPITSSSDVWVGSEPEATNPLFGVWCAMARRSFFGSHIDEAEAISIEQALAMVTTNAALVLGEETERGSLAPGKRADFVVLDRDPTRVPVDDLPAIPVHDVVINSRSVL